MRIALVLLAACSPSPSASIDSGEPPRIDAPAPDVTGAPLRVFTTGAFLGTLYESGGGLAAGDTKCARAAGDAALDGTWRAWLSTTAVNAPDRIAGVGPWYLPDRTTLLFASRAQFVTGPSHPIDQLSNGESLDSNVPVWTGTTIGGTAASATCADWTVDQSSSGRAGRLDATNAAWTDDTTLTCGTYAYLYCFEQP